MAKSYNQLPSKKESLNWVERVSKDWQASWDYRETSWHNLWKDWGKLYNSERVLVGYNGMADTFVPMAYSTVEAMVAATAGDKPQVQYFPTKFEQAQETEVLNGLFSYYWDLDYWTPKTIEHSRNLFKTGTSILYGYWNIDHPCLENIPDRDFFIDPTATFFNYQNARYMGYRFLASKAQLEAEQIVNPETGELEPKYKNLDKLGTGRKTGEGDQTAKEEIDTHMGSTLSEDALGDQIEVICYFTLDDVVYVANRSEVIYKTMNFFKQRQQFLGYKNPTGMYPFVIDAYNPTASQLYGTSILQPMLKPNELLNDLTNQNIDAVSWSLDPEMELDPMYADYIDKIKSATGNIYPFKNGSYTPVQKLPIPSSAFNERTNIKNEIREATAVDEIVKGIRAAGGDTTATEIKAQVAQSSRRFDLIVGMLESGGYYTMAKLVFQMIQHYVTAPVMFRVIGEGGVDWQKFDPKQFSGDYEPRVKLKATLDSEKQVKIRDAKEMFTAMVGNPHVNEEELTKFIMMRAFNLDREEASQLVKTKEQMAEEMAPPEEKESPEEVALKGIAKSYGSGTRPDIDAQLEQLAGLEPSATHEGEMGAVAVDQHLREQEGLDGMQTAISYPQELEMLNSGPQGRPENAPKEDLVGTYSG